MKYVLTLVIILLAILVGFTVPLLSVILTALLFLVVLVTSLLPNQKQKPSSVKKSYHHFTIIIPSYKEGSVLKKTLTSILSCNYPQSKINVIVVYRPSKKDKETPQIAMWSKNNHPNVHFYRKEGSKAKAVNFAINKVRNKWVGLFDADSNVRKDFFKIASTYATFCDEKSFSCFIGSYRVENQNKNILTILQSIDMFQIREPLTKLGVLLKEANFHGYNGFFKKKLLKEFPLKEKHPTEDVDLSSRLMAAGIQRLPAPRLLANYSAVTTLKELWHQRKRWARGNWKVLFEKGGVVAIFKSYHTKTMIFESIYQIYSNLAVLSLLTVASSFGTLLLHKDLLIFLIIIPIVLYLNVVTYIFQKVEERTLSFRDIYSVLFPFFFALVLGFIYLVGFSEEILNKRFVWVKL